MSLRRRSRGLWEEGGSVVLGTLMLVFVMTLLGLALFDLSVVESRLVLDARTNVQALEIAEAGTSRGLHLLFLDFACTNPPINPTNCDDPPSPPSFNDGFIAGIQINPGTPCPDTLNPDGAPNFSQFRLLKQAVAFAGGQYTICVRPGPGDNVATLRSLGTMTAVTGTYNRIVEVNAVAVQVGRGGGSAFLSGGPSAGAILGNALIAGSLQLVNCPGAGCVVVEFGGGGGMENNYAQMDDTIKNLIPTEFPDGSTVNTLRAVLKVREGQVVIRSNAAHIGLSENAGNGVQDTMSGVFSNGTWGGSQGNCPPLNGQSTINSRCNVWTETSGGYPPRDLQAVPLLSAPTIIKSTGFKCFFLRPEETCSNPPPLPGFSAEEFFYTNSWHIDDSRGSSGCDVGITGGSAADCTLVLGSFQAGAVPIHPTLGTPITELPIKAAACQRQGGPSNDTACILTIGNGTMTARIDGTPSRPDGLPINVYVHRSAPTSPTVQTSPSVNTTYAGMLMLLIDVPPGTTGFRVSRRLLPSNTVSQPWCGLSAFACGFAYPGNHFLGVLTQGNFELPDPGAAGRFVVANFAAANGDATNPSTITIGGQTQLAGTFSTQRFDMGNQVPKIFQAPYNLNWLPGSFTAAGGVVTKVIATSWREIR